MNSYSKVQKKKIKEEEETTRGNDADARETRARPARDIATDQARHARTKDFILIALGCHPLGSGGYSSS